MAGVFSTNGAVYKFPEITHMLTEEKSRAEGRITAKIE